ncbi:selenoprotein S isoform X1 [Myotis daubentonii]|uniref:selenoprotein S isoform X1 n=1 Tax=Myotis daubentonii TaxID=98922 RepID=UPI002873384C|nr:selenoprotein S isoform X1 [Myotis daubentonii]
MEQDGEQLSARPALESEGLRFLHVTVGSLLAAYGWYLVFGCVLLFAVFQKLSGRLRASRQRRPDPAAAAVAPEDVVRRQEALAAARLKMQEELNAQVERHKEKLRQLEEEKRRRKIEMWDSLQEGKSYRGHARKPQVITLCLGKEEEPARGDLDAEAHHLGDEAKKALPVSLDTKQAQPSPPTPFNCLTHPFSQ